MAALISRAELVERLAEVSHATWVVQGVRDGRTLENPYGPADAARVDSDEGRADLAAAEHILAAVLGGRKLEDVSTNHRHWPSDHDRERAEFTVQEMERLGLAP